MRVLARGSSYRLSNHPRQCRAASIPLKNIERRRHIQIQAAPSSDSSSVAENGASSASTPDAVFEVLGTPYSLLSVTLSPSQPLHTRRGSLVSVSGDASTTVSTLTFLSPLRRALSGIPFLYQRLTTTTPISALISPRSTRTSLAVLHLTGTTDWKITRRNALLAWTGATLHLTPTITLRSLSSSHWGNTTATGRGLLALEGTGNIFSIELRDQESYIAHPSNIIAYSLNSPHTPLPQPYRFKSSTFNLQIPGGLGYRFGNFFPNSRLISNLQHSDTYVFLANLWYRVKTWSRRTIWGDRLFLQFTGPTTILVQSRASRIRDVLSDREVNELADARPGVVGERVKAALEEGRQQREDGGEGGGGEGGGVEGGAAKQRTTKVVQKPPKLSIASVQRDGKVRIEKTDDFEGLKK